MLPESDRKDLAIQALARSTTISDLSVRHRVSRKFVYQQAHKAGAALDEVFLSGTPEDDVLFHLTVSKTWLRQVIVALTLICRSSYRGVVEFLRDLLGVPISIGTVHHVLQSATRQARIVNHAQDLSGILVGLHDEIFQGTLPVLAAVDATSTYCYLLAVAEHRDADTWGDCVARQPRHTDPRGRRRCPAWHESAVLKSGAALLELSRPECGTVVGTSFRRM
jgi:hypothetical protein